MQHDLPFLHCSIWFSCWKNTHPLSNLSFVSVLLPLGIISNLPLRLLLKHTSKLWHYYILYHGVYYQCSHYALIYGIQYLITQKSLECSIEIGGIFLCVTSVGLFICFVIFPAQGLPETSSNEPQKCHKHSFLSPLPKQQPCPQHSFFQQTKPTGIDY